MGVYSQHLQLKSRGWGIKLSGRLPSAPKLHCFCSCKCQLERNSESENFFPFTLCCAPVTPKGLLRSTPAILLLQIQAAHVRTIGLGVGSGFSLHCYNQSPLPGSDPLPCPPFPCPKMFPPCPWNVLSPPSPTPRTGCCEPTLSWLGSVLQEPVHTLALAQSVPKQS